MKCQHHIASCPHSLLLECINSYCSLYKGWESFPFTLLIVVKLQPQPHSPFFCLPYVKYILIKVIGNNLTKSSLWLHYSDDVHIIIYKICLIHLYIYSVKRPEKKRIL